MTKMKDFTKQFVKINRRKSMGAGTRLILGLGLISATGIATTMLLSPKSQKIISSTISKEAKDAIHSITDKSDDVKDIITRGYKSINRDLHKVAKKISKQLD